MLLREERTFFLATHINPDGDALGSTLALALALEALGKETVIYDRDRIPEFYRFLPGSERFTSSLPKHPGHLVLLDCNEPERAGLDNVTVRSSAVIDHHETSGSFGDIRWIVPQAAATGIMVYHLIRDLGVRLTPEIATNLYVAVAIDTGTFRYSNTDAGVLRISADLVDAGADPGALARALYETWSDRRFFLLIRVLGTLELMNGIAFTHVTNDMFHETGTLPEDTEHFSNFPRMIDRVLVSAFFREMDGGWKVSLRSKGEVDVARVAETFRGGGHMNAAGYKVRTDLATAKEHLLRALVAAIEAR